MIQPLQTGEPEQRTFYPTTKIPAYSCSIHNHWETESACLAITQWIDNEWSFILLKRKVKSAGIWMKMEMITLNKVAQAQRNKHCIEVDLKFKCRICSTWNTCKVMKLESGHWKEDVFKWWKWLIDCMKAEIRDTIG